MDQPENYSEKIQTVQPYDTEMVYEEMKRIINLGKKYKNIHDYLYQVFNQDFTQFVEEIYEDNLD